MAPSAGRGNARHAAPDCAKRAVRRRFVPRERRYRQSKPGALVSVARPKAGRRPRTIGAARTFRTFRLGATQQA
ncbi:hypothetical protein AQ809_20380 [Burkholderia pseudomallei]|nr:hypothetical protein X990_4172 [Burkholderia pseudomallei MSHR4868]KGW36362.1 hypothetical protein Y602_5683 [Burkholderia pseudomallei MSHR733]KIX36381.1 hypothetical protein SZ28_24095 [Burkholderia pseudomallei]OMW48394.1 hypothetical protein AQ809_20380 [Burkholderia pseudomallei]OMX10825.1 hypothetical protein AQ819_27320 [Burkholderia pseudomallei]